MHAFGAHFAEVQVDKLTGEVRVTRFVGAFACGRILNAKTATSQLKAASSWTSAWRSPRPRIWTNATAIL
jgi:CO/xanthine dehydrogenase Mo-binding subunit